VIKGSDTVLPLSQKEAEDYIEATPQTPKGEVREFLDFVLSDKGQNLVKETGYVPVRPAS
jgi:ABC-type phosphate transport system substrate-binding protein